MRIFKYFKELLSTLKTIEKHLKKIASCVESEYSTQGNRLEYRIKTKNVRG